jgi:MFS family permease
MTILLSALLDFILHKSRMNRAQAFALFWLVFLAVPLILGIIFRQTDSETALGIFTAMMGMTFGFGLTQVPALVSDVFGNDKCGFAFGIVQIGAIAAAAATLPVMETLGRIGVMVAFFVAAGAHVAMGLGVLLGALLGVKMEEKPLTVASMLEETDLVL